MNAWTALLEALHSALIDELNERFPDEKLELGLPRRVGAWGLPSADIGDFAWCEVVFDGNPVTGVAVVALECGSRAGLGISAAELWAQVVKRAGRDFARRKIAPRFSEATSGSASLGATSPDVIPSCEIDRLIWFPLKLKGAGCFLGVGICRR